MSVPPFLDVKPTADVVGSSVSGAAARLNNDLYYAGGTTSTGAVTNAFTQVNLFNEAVTPLAPMPTARAGLGLVGFFYNQNGTVDAILAVGGTNGSSVLGNVELYNPVTGTWTELAPLPTPRAYLTVGGWSGPKNLRDRRREFERSGRGYSRNLQSGQEYLDRRTIVKYGPGASRFGHGF